MKTQKLEENKQRHRSMVEEAKEILNNLDSETSFLLFTIGRTKYEIRAVMTKEDKMCMMLALLGEDEEMKQAAEIAKTVLPLVDYDVRKAISGYLNVAEILRGKDEDGTE